MRESKLTSVDVRPVYTLAIMSTASPLQPVDPATFHLSEQEKEKPWILRKIVQSLTGRVVIALGQTLHATGTTVICLSPWGMYPSNFCVVSKDINTR